MKDVMSLKNGHRPHQLLEYGFNLRQIQFYSTSHQSEKIVLEIIKNNYDIVMVVLAFLVYDIVNADYVFVIHFPKVHYLPVIRDAKLVKLRRHHCFSIKSASTHRDDSDYRLDTL